MFIGSNFYIGKINNHKCYALGTHNIAQETRCLQIGLGEVPYHKPTHSWCHAQPYLAPTSRLGVGRY